MQRSLRVKSFNFFLGEEDGYIYFGKRGQGVFVGKKGIW